MRCSPSSPASSADTPCCIDPVRSAHADRRGSPADRLRHRGQGRLHGRRPPARGARAPRRVPVHPWPVRDDVPRAAVDHPPVRGLRLGRGDERTLPLPPRAGPDRPLGRFRPADAAGLRLGRPARRGRGRAHRGRDRLARGHGGAPRRDPARRGLDVDDDQRAGCASPPPLRARRRGAGRVGREAARDGPERRPQGVRRPRQLHLPSAPVHAARDGSLRVLRRARPELEHDLDLGVPHPRGGSERCAGARVHARERDRVL